MVCGTGDSNLPQPGDPSNDLVLSATTVFGGIYVYWNAPSINPHAVAHYAVYRSSLNNVVSAAFHRTEGGNGFIDPVGGEATNKTYYYWVSVISINGTVGELVGVGQGQVVNIAEQLLNYLNGSIPIAALNPALLDILSEIPSTSEDLVQEISDRIDDAEATSALLAGLSTVVSTLEIDNAAESVSVADAISAVLDTFNASISQVNTVIASQSQTVAQALTDVQVFSTAYDLEIAAVQLDLTAVIDESGSLSAQWQVKSNVGGLQAGIGLFNDGTQTALGINAQRFYILNSDTGGGVNPFIIDDNDVYMDEAFINTLHVSKLIGTTGYFDTLHLKDGAVTVADLIEGVDLVMPGGAAYPETDIIPNIDVDTEGGAVTLIYDSNLNVSNKSYLVRLYINGVVVESEADLGAFMFAARDLAGVTTIRVTIQTGGTSGNTGYVSRPKMLITGLKR